MPETTAENDVRDPLDPGMERLLRMVETADQPRIVDLDPPAARAWADRMFEVPDPPRPLALVEHRSHRREQRVGALPPDPGRAQRHRLVLPGERVGPRRRPREQKRGTVPEKRRHRTARLEPHRGSKRRRESRLGARVRLEQKQPSVGQRAKPREALVEAELPRDANDALVARQRDRGRGGDASRAPP